MLGGHAMSVRNEAINIVSPSGISKLSLGTVRPELPNTEYGTIVIAAATAEPFIKSRREIVDLYLFCFLRKFIYPVFKENRVKMHFLTRHSDSFFGQQGF